MRHLTSRDIDMIAVGERLRDMILLQHPSVVEFAAEIGVSRNTMYRMFKGEFPCVPVLVDPVLIRRLPRISHLVLRQIT